MSKTTSVLTAFAVGTLLAGLGVTGCGKKNRGSEAAAMTVPEKAAEETAVCIYDGTALKQDPSKNGKWLASIALGEVVKDLGDSKIDTSDKNRSYIKVQLSDGKTGWANGYGLVLHAKLGAVKEDTVIHKRPDLVTGTDQKVDFMGIVAISQEKGEWVEFTGENHKKTGWIHKDAVTYDPSELAVAVLATKKLRPKDPKDREAAMKKFVDTCPYPDTTFAKKLREKLATPSAPESKPAVGEPANSEFTPEGQEKIEQ